MLKYLAFFLLCGLAWAAPTGRIQGSASHPVAVYRVDESLQADLSSKRLLPVGDFALEGLAPGRYQLESPPVYLPGENAAIDSIFAGGGCVYFERTTTRVVEVEPGQTTRVEFR
jgi:hypothetical protein